MRDDRAASDWSPGDDLATRLGWVGSLGEPGRRALYLWVVAQPEPVTRDEAAAGVSVARHVAKFHLDKLVDEGLLEVEYGRPPGRRGPGAGRPAKRYRRAAREVTVSLPERNYELAGRLLARAVDDAARDGRDVREALRDAARDTGHRLGTRAREKAGARPSRAKLRAATDDVLAEAGYEPRDDGGDVVLVNCPFHALAQDYTDLVCGMNLELLHGLVDEVGPAGLEPVLEPVPGRCCVVMRACGTDTRTTKGDTGA
jgi:predicted ArsR family transcriptional regulator